VPGVIACIVKRGHPDAYLKMVIDKFY